MNSAVIETVSGTFIDLLNPKPEDILPQDIGWALSRIPRYAGHTITEHAYTVAQHSIFTTKLTLALLDEEDPHIQESFGRFCGTSFSRSDVVNSNAVLHVLLHDASEAYILDIPTPIKKGIPGIKEHYGALECRVMGVIWERFGLGEPNHVAKLVVEWADRYALTVEAYHLMKSRGSSWNRILDVPFSALQKFEFPRPPLEVYEDFMHLLEKFG